MKVGTDMKLLEHFWQLDNNGNRTSANDTDEDDGDGVLETEDDNLNTTI